MAKFVYRMQNILDIKYKMESQAKSHYATTRMRLNQEQEKLERLFAEKRDLEEHYRELASGTLNVMDLMEGRRAIDFQKELIKEQLVQLKVAEKNFEMARVRLNEVMKERKTQEKLKERAFEQFMQELADQEKKEIDELVSYKYGSAGAN